MKEKNIEFLEILKNLKIKNICNELHINRSNFYNCTCHLNNIEEVKKELGIKCQIIANYLLKDEEFYQNGIDRRFINHHKIIKINEWKIIKNNRTFTKRELYY